MVVGVGLGVGVTIGVACNADVWLEAKLPTTYHVPNTTTTPTKLKSIIKLGSRLSSTKRRLLEPCFNDFRLIQGEKICGLLAILLMVISQL